MLLAAPSFGQNSISTGQALKSSSSRVAASGKKLTKKKYHKHPYITYYDQKIKEYEQRMQANAKRDKKLARLMKKPQYADPSYFGHKHKPKKRPPGKRKLCKECGIVH